MSYSTRLILRLTLFICLFSAGVLPALSQEGRAADSASLAVPPLKYKLIRSDSYGYGYNIFVGNTLYVHQPVIPCLAGNRGFKTKADARKVASLIIEKIRKGIIPPSVTISEMEKLRIDMR
jgi:hypothetical protein